MENFESSLSEILEVEGVDLSDELESFEAWDSLTRLSIIAYCGDAFNVTLSADEIENSKTIQGLRDLITTKMT